MKNAYEWMTHAFDHGLRALAVAATFGTPLVILAVHHGHHLWLIGVSGGAVVFLALGEGAYKTWADVARLDHGTGTGTDPGLIKRLRWYAKKGDELSESLVDFDEAHREGRVDDARYESTIEWHKKQADDWRAEVGELLREHSPHAAKHFLGESALIPKHISLRATKLSPTIIDLAEARKRLGEVIEWLD